MNNAGQTPIYPAYANNISNVPSMLREDVTLSGITP